MRSKRGSEVPGGRLTAGWTIWAFASIVLIGIAASTAVLERVRERLALALTNGRVPSFTVSFGLAESTHADTFDGVVALADHALLAAKTEGRNRVVLAVEPV